MKNKKISEIVIRASFNVDWIRIILWAKSTD